MLSIPFSNVLSIFYHGTVMLKSNPGKTDTLHFILQYFNTKQPSFGETTTFTGTNIIIKKKARNLINSLFSAHINEVCKKATLAMR